MIEKILLAVANFFRGLGKTIVWILGIICIGSGLFMLCAYFSSNPRYGTNHISTLSGFDSIMTLTGCLAIAGAILFHGLINSKRK